MIAIAPVLILLVAAAISVHADPTPTEPAPNDVYIQGQTCPIAWEADSTGTWKNMSIQIMTGDNFNMLPLAYVATNINAATQTTYDYPCPTVSPHSPIYFYQFSTSTSPSEYWTGRFTITDNASDITPPSESTQPNGEAIPWGIGSIVTSGSASGTSSSPASGTISSPASGTISSPTAAPGSPSGVYPITASSANSAIATRSISNVLPLTALALGLFAVGFVVVF